MDPSAVSGNAVNAEARPLSMRTSVPLARDRMRDVPCSSAVAGSVMMRSFCHLLAVRVTLPMYLVPR
jgi:hypothetical protein